MAKKEEIIDAIRVLRNEVEVLTSRLKPHATGHLHTSIDVINSRIDELIEEGMYGKASAQLIKEAEDKLRSII
tara:strand:- start:289 stop:507 length:219 start_codon:yes stop_codon:yes gene_type:complete